MSHARSRHLGNAGNGRTIYHRAQVTGDPNGNRTQRRAWKRQKGRSATQAAFAPEDTQDGQTAAHGPAGRHDGHSTDDSDEHYPWNYTEHGVLCVCGQPMNADEQCPAAPTERTTP